MTETVNEAHAIFAVDLRFRIRVTAPISQIEIKHLHSELKEKLLASEIVFKYENADVDLRTLDFYDKKLFKEDLRDSKVHMGLLRDFYHDKDIPEEQWELIEKMMNTYISQLSLEESSLRNVKWSIKKLKFENTFAYGKNNIIDFDHLGGVTGIFGKNRTGKSSIPGTMMYGLFNTTDRGSIKNLHIINSRKGHCLVKIDVSVNGRLYRIERQSVKHQTKKGKLHAVTHLNLLQIDEEGDVIRDLTGEQRRETEKALRDLLGTSDDFLLTSLASQGEMNAFIKHRTTNRKSILSKFLDLNIFDKLHEKAKEDSNEIRGLLRAVPDREWDTVLHEKKDELRSVLEKRDNVEIILKRSRTRLQNLRITMATHKEKDLVTADEVEKQELEVKSSRDNTTELQGQIKQAKNDGDLYVLKLEKIHTLQEQFPIDELRQSLAAQKQLEAKLVDIDHQLEKEKTLLQSQEKSIKKLGDVPCGDRFPTCKFIKESHENKSKLTGQEEKVDELISHLKAANRALKLLTKDSLNEKISRYDQILIDERDLNHKVLTNNLVIEKLIHEKEGEDVTLENLKQRLSEMRLQVRDDIPEEVLKIRGDIKNLSIQINQLDVKRLNTSEKVGLLTSEISNLDQEKAKYSEIMKKWRAYELFMNAVSKKGIPLRIMSAQLPAINEEISKILQGVVGFTVELEADQDSNDMHIFINYGDSRRIIECASGMEKMVASLAIRVALINVSSLPKTDLLIIDEGFGSLDEMNVEAVNRLLDSLKQWFKNILVISHVDAVKDAVDNTIEITKKNKDAQVRIEG